MNVDINLLEKFEQNLDPQNIEASDVKVNLIGFGEISSIIEIEAIPGIVFKRMPLFKDEEEALEYKVKHEKYCSLLEEIGIALPENDAFIVKRDSKITSLYIAQTKLESNSLGNKYILNHPEKDSLELFREVVRSIEKVWNFNKANKGKIEMAIDSQISNWAKNGGLYYIDTSTPLFKLNGVEQLNPELILASAPSFGRAIIRKFFLDDVMSRYYDPKSVYIDLIANLYKEKKSELIPQLIDLINKETDVSVTEKEVLDYYKEDKFIWSLFLKLRKIDKWLFKYLYRKQYQYILPDKIER
ncbi:MAG: DUF6206 family protein [Bacteroidota bacterium]